MFVFFIVVCFLWFGVLLLLCYFDVIGLYALNSSLH